MNHATDIYVAGRNFAENFFWEKYRKIERVYSLDGGLFALGTDNDIDFELLWGVNTLEQLHKALPAIRRDYPRFIFRYAGSIETVVSRRAIISRWNCDIRATYVGYSLLLREAGQQLARNRRIHRLKPSHIEEFLKVEEAIFHFPNLARPDLTSCFESSDRVVWVLMLAGRISGFVTLNQCADQPDCWLIRDLGVCQEVRLRGWGRRLLVHALADLAHRNARKAMLWVDYDNLPARKLYENVGFSMNENEAETIFAVE